MGMEWMMGSWWMGGMMWIGWLIGLSSLALVVLGVVAAIRWLVRGAVPPANARRPNSALEVLRERYARGEVDRDEFERMRQDLS